MNRRAFTAIMSGLAVAAVVAPPRVEGDTSDPTPDHKVLLKEGNEIRLKFSQELTSKTAAEGDPVNFVLDEDVKAGDTVLIKAGAKAVGTVTNAKKAGMMGKGGELNIRLEHLKAGDNRGAATRKQRQRRRQQNGYGDRSNGSFWTYWPHQARKRHRRQRRYAPDGVCR